MLLNRITSRHYFAALQFWITSKYISYFTAKNLFPYTFFDYLILTFLYAK